MRVAIAGGHGRIARRLTRLLVARGDRVRSLIEAPDAVEDIRADGAEPFVCDVGEASHDDIAAALATTNALVFAGDAGVAMRLIEAASAARVRRFVMVSTVGAADPPDGTDVWSGYLRAQARADAALQLSGLDWTIVRPATLDDATDEGRVVIDTDPPDGVITREDVAMTLAAVVHEPRAARMTLYVAAGDYPVDWALSSVLAARRAVTPGTP
jgi:uncharacterized protein YbjT (DUF2867 family)